MEKKIIVWLRNLNVSSLCAGNVILLIDEVHTLVGSGSVGRGGSAGSGLDIANLLKPALARGDLQVNLIVGI